MSDVRFVGHAQPDDDSGLWHWVDFLEARLVEQSERGPVYLCWGGVRTACGIAVVPPGSICRVFAGITRPEKPDCRACLDGLAPGLRDEIESLLEHVEPRVAVPT